MDIFNSLISSQDIIIRGALTILIALYGLFALIVAVQVNNLNKVVNQAGFSGVLNFISLVHFFAAIALLFFAVLSL